MKHLLKNLLVILVLITSFSFTKSIGSDVTGTYGVSADDPSAIKLTLTAEHTFNYQDFSDPKHKIQVSGTWEQKGKFVKLKSSDGSRNFHSTWKFLEDGKIAKSRKGMCFYRICKL